MEQYQFDIRSAANGTISKIKNDLVAHFVCILLVNLSPFWLLGIYNC